MLYNKTVLFYFYFSFIAVVRATLDMNSLLMPGYTNIKLSYQVVTDC